jgi:hypothetical protein
MIFIAVHKSQSFILKLHFLNLSTLIKNIDLGCFEVLCYIRYNK